jgi:hypothetical protein
MALHLHLNPELNVGYYEVAVDGGTPVSVTPAADGSADFDLSTIAPGAHTVSAVAVNASGSSLPTEWPFTVALPAPAAPSGDIEQ